MNIAEILKHCKTGIKLYSTVHGEVEYIYINKYDEKYPIVCKDEMGYAAAFTIDGRIYHNYSNAECVLFPSKTQRDWNKFTIPIKKSDITMKIKPKYRPFVTNKECLEEMLKHKPFGWVKEDVDYCNIIHIGRYGINLNNGVGNDYYNYKSSFKLKFIDDTPFGIKED